MEIWTIQLSHVDCPLSYSRIITPALFYTSDSHLQSNKEQLLLLPDERHTPFPLSHFGFLSGSSVASSKLTFGLSCQRWKMTHKLHKADLMLWYCTALLDEWFLLQCRLIAATLKSIRRCEKPPWRRLLGLLLPSRQTDNAVAFWVNHLTLCLL